VGELNNIVSVGFLDCLSLKRIDKIEKLAAIFVANSPKLESFPRRDKYADFESDSEDFVLYILESLVQKKFDNAVTIDVESRRVFVETIQFLESCSSKVKLSELRLFQ
jgi:hypothetical protein